MKCCSAIGFWVFVVLGISLFFLFGNYIFSAGYSLKLPGEDFWGGGLLLIAKAIVPLAAMVWGLGAAIIYLRKNRGLSLMYFIGVGIALGTHYLPERWPYLEGVRQRLLPIDEGRYLDFARQVRTTLGEERFPDADLRELDHPQDGSGKSRAEKFLKIVESSGVLANWPRWLLQVRVEEDSVVLSRGSGMLGMIGVEIFDRGPVREPQGPHAPRANSYVPVEYVLSPRVYLYTSD
ncbi:MAG: hypothetical protein JF599_04795 [Verrucomicrobia bacterium]|nr:hypothetical protein [Verrucomicrobiota bacterium]